MWRHTWQRNWVNCAVLTGNSAGLRTVLSSPLSHRELRSSLRESHSFLSLPADTAMASSKCTNLYNIQHPSLAIHSEDKHRMTYSCSNTTFYSIFYDFFSSLGITLRPMWLANSQRQPCFIHHSHTHEKTHRTDQKKKTDKPDGKTVQCQRTFSAVFVKFLYTIIQQSLTLSVWGPLNRPNFSSEIIPHIGSRVQLKREGTRWRTGGEVKGKLANGVGSQYPSHYLGIWCMQHYYRWCAHLGCQ